MARSELLAEALKLSHEERELLAQELFESIDAEQTAEEREAWTDAWAREVAKRLDDVRSGRVGGIRADEAMASIRSAVEAHRRS